MKELALDKYDPDQPRAPEGTATGGQWTGEAGAQSYAELNPRKYPSQAAEWQSHYKTAFDATPEDERAAFAYYRGRGYHDINEFNRGKSVTIEDGEERKIDKAFAAEQTALLDSMIARGETPEGVVTWRGIGYRPKLKAGDTFTDKGFVSTTLNKQRIDMFTLGPGDTHGKGAVFEIQLDKGTPSYYCEALSNGMQEYEMLLPRNTKFEVLEVSTITLDVYGSKDKMPLYKVRVAK